MKIFNQLDRMLLFFLITLFISVSFAGQTGKVAGRVIDSETGEPVIGANIIVEGTYLGAAADIDGDYFINNIPPGTYNVIVSAIGYRRTVIQEVVIKIDITTRVDVELRSEAIELNQEVVVIAERPMIDKDLTSTAATVSADEIKMMPVENITQVINLQAGVIDGHFRGGRSNEVAYLIDGVPVTDVFSGSNSVEVENSSVRALEVISGTFNAEYGQALSGVVNIVTKDGGNRFEGNVSAFTGSYFSKNTDLFEELDSFKPETVKDVQFSLSGPTKLLSGLTFFVTGRYFENDGYLYGKKYYNTSDFHPAMPTGNGESVSMNPHEKKSFNGKLTYSIENWKFSYSMFWDDNYNRYYSHFMKWTPDGMKHHYKDNLIHSFQASFVPDNRTVVSLKLSSNRHNFNGYLFEDEFDDRYVDPKQGLPVSDYTFRTGGNESDRYHRTTKTQIAMFSIESQVSKYHKIKLGAEGSIHELFNHWKEIYNLTEGQIDENGNEIFTLGYREENAPGHDKYTKKPFQFSAYLQDKMEYEMMVINAGVRFDYFNSNTTLPVDLRNPSQRNPNPDFAGAGETEDVEAKYQISPRLGVSFPISDKGAIYFSYGHFFQIPNFENLYINHLYNINPGQSLSSLTGNPDLKAQKTIKYELGLQQILMPDLSIDVTAYYSDIRNLLGTEIKSTYEGFKFGRYINRDYGNVKGFILTLDKRFSDFFSAKIDYTYMVAEGNSSDPLSVYNDNQSDPPVESEKKVVPLNWDQRSTLNFSTTVGVPGNWTVSIIAQYGSGMPYTEDIRISNGVRFENGGRKPNYVNVDLKADKFFDLFGLKVHTYLLVYNLLDIENEYTVYGTTGRANSDLNVKYAGDIIGFNTIEQYVNDPGWYSAPRQIRVGFSCGF